MDQQYTYYTPDQNGSQNPYREPEKKPEKKKEDPGQTAVYESLEEKMKAALGTKVSINRKNEKSGRIEIEYYSMEELERLMDILVK